MLQVRRGSTFSRIVGRNYLFVAYCSMLSCVCLPLIGSSDVGQGVPRKMCETADITVHICGDNLWDERGSKSWYRHNTILPWWRLKNNGLWVCQPWWSDSWKWPATTSLLPSFVWFTSLRKSWTSVWVVCLHCGWGPQNVGAGELLPSDWLCSDLMAPSFQKLGGIRKHNCWSSELRDGDLHILACTELSAFALVLLGADEIQIVSFHVLACTKVLTFLSSHMHPSLELIKSVE